MEEQIKENSLWYDRLKEYIPEIAVWVASDLRGWFCEDTESQYAEKAIEDSLKLWASVKQSEDSLEIIKK